MIGKLYIDREDTDEYGCVRFEQHLYPNGRLGDRIDYVWGRLYLREPDFERYVEIMRSNDVWDVSVRSVPSYAQMSGTERS